MLRTDVAGIKLWLLWGACALVGILSAMIVAYGNPGNMGVCGACFLRDTAGALGLSAAEGPRIFRPELVGLVLGALVCRLVRGPVEGRAGAHSAVRFSLGLWMGVGTLVFLGCPFRMLQRMGGGDLNAWVGLIGFVAGVGAGRQFEARGYTSGKTAPVFFVAGSPAWLLAVGGLVLFLTGQMPYGPGPADLTSKPPHAPWYIALGLAGVAGALLSLTGFCAISAARQVFGGPRRMLWAALALIAGYAVCSMVFGKMQISFENQPISHRDHVWGILAMALVGLTGVLAGGCPVRHLVLAGEGNNDSMVTAAGILLGCCLAHSFQTVSTPEGTTYTGRLAVMLGLGFSTTYATLVVLAKSREQRITGSV
ncbi:MAG: YedE-related selenium metabolism membrane protein [Planctomycetaceae bacterium]|nr:YedE-related selenium metabolism membrane protein [Planctomycetaceae bacterium]